MFQNLLCIIPNDLSSHNYFDKNFYLNHILLRLKALCFVAYRFCSMYVFQISLGLIVLTASHFSEKTSWGTKVTFVICLCFSSVAAERRTLLAFIHNCTCHAWPFFRKHRNKLDKTCFTRNIAWYCFQEHNEVHTKIFGRWCSTIDTFS